jgi:choice-of-anchor A domain-containing protein
MFRNGRNDTVSYAGIPYDDINWYDVNGQPFGTASHFNAIIFGDANNIVDVKGAMAVGGSFVSPRGLSLAYGNDNKLTGTGYSPDLVRFLVGENVAMQGPLVVIGHVVAGGNFRAAGGSTYMIGKDGSSDQAQELSMLYQAAGGSQYWRPSDRGSHYVISSYDVPRFIPAGRIHADVRRFFEDAKASINYYHDCIVNMEPNGTVTPHFHELILRGSNPVQNVFVVDARPNGILDKELRFEVPEGSVSIVILKTGPRAHMQYGLWGAERLAARTLYVFEDAANIHMEVPADIWGSILAPQAMFHAHPTGGHVSGNAALGSFAVNPASGFEFHLFPFVGGISCEEVQPVQPEIMPLPEIPAPVPECPVCPTPEPCPVCPAPEPCPVCPAPEPCPQPEPCPACPTPEPCPQPEPCPVCPTPEPCPQPEPCPVCPTPEPCPVCPEPEPCPEQAVRIEYRPYPVRVPMPCPNIRMRVEYREVPCKQDCKIKPGIILGCIWGCACCGSHDFEVKLYEICDEKNIPIYCEKVSCCGCFEFEVPYDGCYLLEVCASGQGKISTGCKPVLTLKNVGVSSLRVEA